MGHRRSFVDRDAKIAIQATFNKQPDGTYSQRQQEVTITCIMSKRPHKAIHIYPDSQGSPRKFPHIDRQKPESPISPSLSNIPRKQRQLASKVDRSKRQARRLVEETEAHVVVRLLLLLGLLLGGGRVGRSGGTARSGSGAGRGTAGTTRGDGGELGGTLSDEL